jgi:hypothetical protein
MSTHEPSPNLAAAASSTTPESTVDRPNPGIPSDSATLTEMVNTLEKDGYVHQFTPVSGGAVECSECSTRIEAAALEVASIRRLEGASDPDDMMSLVAARCPNCDALGTLILGYGVNATVDDADISRALNVSDVARETGTPPGSVG